jgi:hypothetical protein
MARRPGQRRVPLSPRALAIGGWLVVILLILGIAAAVRILGGNGDGDRLQPSPSASGADTVAIVFGTTLADDRSVPAEAVTKTFHRADRFAYAVPDAAPATEAYVEVRRVGGGPIEVVQAPVEAQQVPNGPATIGFSVPASALFDAFGAGSYEMLIYLDPAGDVIATGRFTLVAEPSASP